MPARRAVSPRNMVPWAQAKAELAPPAEPVCPAALTSTSRPMVTSMAPMASIGAQSSCAMRWMGSRPGATWLAEAGPKAES